jgi:CubicO group peptidase (beta-lactamase class C family)
MRSSLHPISVVRLLAAAFLLGCTDPSTVEDVSVYACEAPAPSAGAEHPRHARYVAHLESLTAEGIPGVVASVDQGGRLWTGARGYADLHHRVPMAPCMRFRSASFDKLRYAAAVLRLVDQGRLRLDAPLSAVLPPELAFVPAADVITLRHLLEHTSGLPARGMGINESLEFFNDADGSVTTRTPAAYFDYLRGARPDAPPGVRWRYDNDGYDLVAQILRHAAGEPTYDYLNRTMIDALGMSASRYETALPAGLPRPYLDMFADQSLIDIGYRYTGNQEHYEGALLGGGFSSVYDARTLLDAVFRGEYLSAESREAMQQWVDIHQRGVDVQGFGQMTAYGLGLMRFDTAYGPAYGHEGVITGGAMTAVYFAEHDTIYVAAMNATSVPYYERFFDYERIAEALFGD